MRRIEGSPQSTFIISNVSGPQRIDGPAGSGKTLALVLKCLSLLREAEKAKRPHHAAFVVFSESTRQKVLDSFFLPLDSRGFHLRSRTDNQQSVAVTTLLRWSNEEIKDIVPPYSLLTEDAAVARRDQRGVVVDVLQRYLSEWKTSLGGGLSPELTAALRELSPTLVSMFQHEFGVVIKGMAAGEKRKYLTLQRPKIALPCVTPDDRRFLYAMFEEYKKALADLGIVDLDDVAISHLKLLQMPLRPRRGFDTVFVDEAHSFNPNEIAVLSLLVRETDAPKLVVSVDLPQGLGDKGYDDGGLEAMMLQDVEGVEVQRFPFPSSYRCSQEILNLASFIYAQGGNFYKPIRVPSKLLSNRPAADAGIRPFIRGYPNAAAMMSSIVGEADRMAARLRCKRSDVLIVLLYDELFDMVPSGLHSVAAPLSRKTDVEQERVARRAKHFVLSRPEYLHGLEYEGVLLVGASHGEVPKSDPVKDHGATAVYEIQEIVNKLYLAITRARRQVGVLYDRQPSFLVREAMNAGILEKVSSTV
jgi:superfamily I DNA/RNA helicase